MRKANRSCPVCDHDLVIGLHTQRFELPAEHPLSDGYEVVSCIKCGFVYADTNITQESYDRFYAQFSKYEDAKTGTGGGEKPWDRKRLEYTAKQITGFLKNPQTKILDVGCANGGLLKALQEQGYNDLLGIDPSPLCVNNTRSLGIEAKSGSIFQPLEISDMDCVILSHTLEHVQDVRGAINWIDAALKTDKNSCLYIEVPDATRYSQFVFAPFQDFNTEHINHFSFTSLSNLLKLYGFIPIEQGTKTIASSPDLLYPAIFTFARRSDTSQINSLEFDVSLRQKIEEYIRISRDKMENINNYLSKALSSINHILVWGTGQLTFKLLVETSLAKAEIIAFVDSNPVNQGKSLRNIPIISPDAIRGHPEPIIIASILHQESIADQIHQMQIPNQIIFLRS